MNREIIEGNWQQAKGRIQEQWGRLLGDELVMIAGQRLQVAGKLLWRYGMAKEEAQLQLLRCQRAYATARRRGQRLSVSSVPLRQTF